jgi:hypothetical protein
MTNADLFRYSYAFHEAGHVFVANRLEIPYLKATAILDGGMGAACHLDHDEMNRMIAANPADLDFIARVLRGVICTLKGGEMVDREILRFAEPDVASRATGDNRILVAMIKPIYIDQLRQTEQLFQDTVLQAEQTTKQIIIAPRVPLIVSHLANVIFERKEVAAADLNAIITELGVG